MSGLPALRDAVCAFHQKRDGLSSLKSKNIVVGPGSKELIYLTMRLFDGDVLLASPSWTTYAPQSRLASHEPIIVNTTFDLRWKITPTNLRKAAVSSSKYHKLLVLNNPGNPCRKSLFFVISLKQPHNILAFFCAAGTAYTEGELEALAEVCRECNITVVADEIYGQLHFASGHVSMASAGLYPEGTIVTSSFSKWSSAGGWRVGYALIPDSMTDYKNALISAASHTYSCTPAPMQAGIAKVSIMFESFFPNLNLHFNFRR